MDESKRLIARAALGNPNSAQKAWAKWKLDYPLSEASPILSWAAGYIYNNLKSYGVADPYIMGIYRHNLVSNNLRLAAALPVLHVLNQACGIIPLKSFSLSTQEFSWGNRPVADFDFYSDSRNNDKIWELLSDRGYKALLEISQNEFNSRILNFRGSWNFKDSGSIDLDLHWRIFDHLSLAENRDLVARETITRKTQIGFQKFLSPELDLVVIANHQFLQGEDRFNGIFDFAHQAKLIEVTKVLKIIRQTNTQISMQSTIATLEKIVGIEIHDNLTLINKSLQKVRKKKYEGKISYLPRYLQKTNLYIIEQEHRHPHVYKLWLFFGRHALLEKFLLKHFGPFSKCVEMPKSGFDFTLQKEFGVGWHYQYPNDELRWGHTPDSRIAWQIVPNKTYRVTIEFNAYAWSVSPVESVNVFFNGIYIETWRKEFAQNNWLFNSSLNFLEISFRPERTLDYMSAGPQFNWYRLSIPIRSVIIEEIIST